MAGRETSSKKRNHRLFLELSQQSSRTDSSVARRRPGVGSRSKKWRHGDMIWSWPALASARAYL
eukprot:3864517-Pyramimonas_sp.AAC.1